MTDEHTLKELSEELLTPEERQQQCEREERVAGLEAQLIQVEEELKKRLAEKRKKEDAALRREVVEACQAKLKERQGELEAREKAAYDNWRMVSVRDLYIRRQELTEAIDALDALKEPT